MRVRPEDLSRRLAAGALAPVWLVYGSEPLQIEESLDTIRAAARTQGHDERVVLHADTGFDWSELRQYRDSLSLFAEKRLVDLRLSRTKLERIGAQALLHYAERPNPDCMLLLSAGALDWREQRARWYQALDKAGAVVQTWPVPPRQLPRWIAQRGHRRGLVIAEDAAAALAERVEGNLLAAAQELDKLLLLHGKGRIGLDDALASSADSSRYGAFDAGDAAMAGNAVRALRVLERLREEGTEITFVSFALAREIRGLASMADAVSRGEEESRVLARHRVRDRRRGLVTRALRRHRRGAWAAMLRQAAHLDRVIKGAERGTPWDEAAQLALMLAGAPVLRANQQFPPTR